MIVSTVIALLGAEPAVTALVPAESMYPRFMPDGVNFPAIVVSKATGVGSYDLQGEAGLENARVQVDIYVDTGYGDLTTIRNAVRRLLSGFKGGPAGGACAIASSFVINDLDLSEPNTERTGPRLKRRMLEFSIWNREL